MEANRGFFHSAPLLYIHNADEFEFEFEAKTNQDVSNMSFADDLLRNGQVVLPLKLPPRMQNVNSVGNNVGSSRSSRLTSPLRSPFGRKRDFDPFAAALEKVRKEEEREERGRGSPCRRTRSVSPLRGEKDKSLEPTSPLMQPRREISVESEGCLGGEERKRTISIKNILFGNSREGKFAHKPRKGRTEEAMKLMKKKPFVVIRRQCMLISSCFSF